MLSMKLYKDECIQIGDEIRIYFKGGTPTFGKIGIDAPREVNIKRVEEEEESEQRVAAAK